MKTDLIILISLGIAAICAIANFVLTLLHIFGKI